jgi:hypothetical protein
MIKILLFLKKKIPFIWHFIEFINGLIFKTLFYNRINKNASSIIGEFADDKYTYRFLNEHDLDPLQQFFHNQDKEQFTFFKPHDFDIDTLRRLIKNPSFFMFGVFDNDKLVAYFFLRCFINKKSFTGRMVDANYQGQGIAKNMGRILHHIAWDSNFRVFGTASTKNSKSIRSYQAINNFKIIKELDNDFIFFEYLKTEERIIPK